jgi:guanine nucleotide-binding protein subunit alpha
MQNRRLEMGECMPIEYLKAFKCLWVDNGFTKAVQRGFQFALLDNLS